MDFLDGVDKSLNENLEQKIIHHRDRFYNLFVARYLEMLPSLIHYKNSHYLDVNFLKVEVALRAGYDVVIGETRKHDIQVLGYVRSKKTTTNPKDLFSQNELQTENIHFTIPKELRLPHYKEITDFSGSEEGNFIVLRNKTLNYTTDHQIIQHYASELAEIVLSRYSISMQVKISTLFLDEIGNETVNEIINSLYNGNPYIKLSKLFDPDEQIYHMKNDNMAQNFQELKREYQNKISELNSMIGMSALAVEKSSGVSDEEAKGNRGFKTSNANIYLDARNNALQRLNKRYKLKHPIEAIYNDEVLSEYAEIAKEEGEEDGNNTNNL